MIYLQLIKEFFLIGAFSFGGGYACLPFIQKIVIDKYNWMTAFDFTNVITISQITPGPIGINIATFLGMQLGGLIGAICTTISYVFPSSIIIIILAKLYFKYRNLCTMQCILDCMKPAVVALIGSSTVTLLCNAFWNNEKIILNETNFIAVSISIICFIIMKIIKIDPIKIILLSGFLGFILYKII